MRHILAVLALLPMLAFAGAALAGGIEVGYAWARASIGTERPGVAYMAIHNSGSESDRLLGAKTAVAKRAMVHESIMRDGVMKMRPAEDIDIAPGATVMLEPGGLHLMLTFLQKKLVEGESFPLTLTFEHAGEVTVDVVIAGMGASKAPQGHHMHHENHDSQEHQKHHEEHQKHHDSQEHQEHHEKHHE
jgi:copper(I)-binding protein